MSERIFVASRDSRMSEPDAPHRTVDALPASRVEAENLEWLWPGRFAVGKLGLLVGPPGVGKSQITLAMAAAVSSGGEWPCGEGRAAQGSVVILSSEDAAPDTARPRLEAAGADLNRVYFLSSVREEDRRMPRAFSLKADLDLLALVIEAIGDVRLVIIDPVSSYLAGAASGNNALVRALLDPLAELAYRMDVVVLAISHLSRIGSGRALDRVVGSLAFPAAARSASMIVKDGEDEDRRLFVELKNNLGPPADGLAFRMEQTQMPGGIVAPVVRWEAEPVAITADEALRAMPRDGDQWTKAEAANFLRQVLAKGPVAVEQIELQAADAGYMADEQSISQSKAFRLARQALGIKPHRLHGRPESGRWAWALPAPEATKKS